VLRLAVLISGRGSNLRAIAAAIDEGHLDASVAAVVSNRPAAPGLAWSAERGLPTLTLDHRRFATRAAFDEALVAELRAVRADAVALAGFDRLVGATLLRAFPDAVLNVHPALLPAFKGLHAQRQALVYGVRVSGATVHFVDEDVDHGPIVLQGAVAILPHDTEDTLGARILEVEHRLYPLALQLLAAGRLRVEGRHVHITGPLPPAPPPLLWLG
jgi:phosphoribosylglycinamide formyltransferase-1